MQFECKSITCRPEAMNVCKGNSFSLIVARSFMKFDDLFFLFLFLFTGSDIRPKLLRCLHKPGKCFEGSPHI